MRKDQKVQTIINGSAAAGALVRRPALEAWLAEEYGIEESADVA